MHIRGIGPTPSEFLVVGEGPNWEDDKKGMPFQGKLGDELDRYLDGNNLPSRQDVFLCYLYRDYKGKKYKWTDEDLQQYEPELLADLQRVTPKIIITLGRPATRWFLGEVDIHACEGLPWYLPTTCTKYPCPPEGVVVFPIISPGAGMHNPEMSPYVVQGFKALSDFLEGDLRPRRLYDDPYAGKEHYEQITSSARLREVTRHWTKATSVGVDSEGYPHDPWSLQFSTQPGTGYCIRKSTAGGLLREFVGLATRRGVRLVFHSALHDLQIGQALDIPFDGLPFDDTLVMAYLLQLVPQGLKEGSLRYCNMQMESFADVMGDTQNDLTRDWLTWIYDAEQFDYEAACEAEFVRLTTTPYQDAKGNWKSGRKLKVHPKLPKSPLQRAVSRVMQSTRPHKLWLDQVEDIQVAGYNRMGRLPEATLEYQDPERALRYACRDPDATVRLAAEYRPRIEALGLEEVYQLELSTYPLIHRMGIIGIKPDLDQFKDVSLGLGAEVESLRNELVAVTGRKDFNANSGDQVAEYIFGTLGLDEIKLTSSGRGSTNDKILEALEREHPDFPQLSLIRGYRETYKLKNTFVDRIPDYVHRWPYDGRVHATFRTTRVVTGRLASADPNVLAMPKHGKFAKDFRRGWVAEDGHVLGSWDLSQIELRVAAHLSQDPVMLKVYRGELRNPDGSLIDLHAALARRIFGVLPGQQDESKHRLPSKAINFGFWMGQTAQGLEVELRKNGILVSLDDAQKWLDDAHALYKGAKPYMEQRVAEVRRNGFVRCMSGRIRYIGGIKSRDERVRSEAERFAFSTPIQEGAQTVMKTNEHHLWADIIVPLQKKGLWIEPILQIHDDLTLELQEDIVDTVNPMMIQCMEQSYKGLSVPIKTSATAGPNWADMVKLAS